jgi:cytochrome c553
MKTTMTPRAIAILVATLFAVPALASSGDADVGRKKSEPCKACHGEAGISATPDFPNLAGQHADYLAAAISHYKNGKRKNPIMQGQVANLTPRDIADLTAYYSRLPGLKQP